MTPKRDINDLKSHYIWRKTLMLPTLLLLLASQVLPLTNIPEPWSELAVIASIVSTMLLFAIALVDWWRGASEGQAFALLVDQVDSHDKRLNKVEGAALPASDADINSV